MASYYADIIREEVARMGRIGTDPRHVEAWMRLEHSTLDGLDRQQFRHEVRVAVACIDEAGIERSEDLAKSYGL